MNKQRGFISLIAIGFVALVALTFSIVSYENTKNKSNQVQSFGSFNPVGGSTYRLQSSIGTSNTSITLTSFKEPVSNIPLTMAYANTSILYATIDPQTTYKEFISFSGITQNADGTATLTGVTRGLGFSYPYTASTTLSQAHSGQSILILSNPPQLTNQYAAKANDETIAGNWTFTTTPTGSVPTLSTQFATKGYVDGGILAGAATSTESVTGIVRLATALQTASSTASTANTPLVIQAQNATSTYGNGSTSGLKVVVTQNNGKIQQGFLDLTQGFSFTNTINVTSTTTVKGLTASSTAANPLTLNGVSLSTPSTQGASSTALFNNGSGSLIWTPVSRLLDYVPALSYTSSNATTSRVSFTLPGGSLQTKNIMTVVDYGVNYTAAQNQSNIVEFAYGYATTTAVMTNTGVDSGTCSGDGTPTFTVTVLANASQTSQLVTMVFTCNGTTVTTYNPTKSWSATYSVNSAIDQPVTFKVKTTGSGVNDRYDDAKIISRLEAY